MAVAVSVFAGGAAAALFILVLVLAIRQAFRQLTTPVLLPDEQPGRADYFNIFVWFAVSGVLIYILGIFFNSRLNNIYGTLPQLFRNTFVRSDATPYLGIAQNGYATEGDARFHIVFFPAYPLATRALAMLTGSYLLSAVLLSNACLYIGCIAMFKLGCIDYGRAVSMRAVRLLLVSPVAFFFRLPFTESMFFMLTVLALFAARRQRYVLSGLFGLLAALTRMTGIIVLGVIIIEAFSAAWKEAAGFSGDLLRKFARKAWPALLVPCGTLIYIAVNYFVTGDPFKFLQYQREHWSNWFSPFYNQVQTITAYMLLNTKARTMVLWFSQFITMFLYLGIMLAGYKKLRASHNAYNLAYYFATTSINWLLSAPRYLMCMFPAYYALAAVTGPKHRSAICFTLSIVALITMTISFGIGQAIY